MGPITPSEFATTTMLSTSTTTPTGQSSVTLTAVVTNQDATGSAGTGQVDFYDGTTDLGRATLDSTGTATLTTSFADPGSHTISAVYDGFQLPGGTYDQSTSTALNVAVAPAVQTIDFGPIAGQTYGAGPIVLDAESSLYLPVTLSVISGPAILDDDILTITGAGTVVVEASQVGDSFTAAAIPVDQSFQVDPAELTITADDQTAVYGAAFPTLTASYSGFVNGDTAADLTTLPILSTTAVGSGVGNYTIIASGAIDTNYTITYVPGQLTITPASLTVTAADQTAVYGAAIPTPAASFCGALPGDLAGLESELSISTAPAGSGVGNYEIDASGVTDPDYDVTYIAGTLSITPAPLTITADSISSAFGASLNLTASFSGLVGGDTPTSLSLPPTMSLATPVTGIGTYEIDVDGAFDPNYTISYVSGTLTVTPGMLTISADDQTVGYGQSLPTLTASYSGLANGDSPASLTTPPTLSLATTPNGVGAYEIDVSGAYDPNYIISYLPGTLTIAVDPTATTLTPSAAAPVVGQDVSFTATVIDASTGLPVTAGSVQFQVDGSDVGDPVSLDSSGTATFDPGALPAGVYNISASFAATTDFQASNETIVETVSQFGTTVNVAAPTVASANQPVTITATVGAFDPTAGVPEGSVTFELDGAVVGSTNLNTSGVASLTLSPLATGLYTITALYSGQGSVFGAGESVTTTVVVPFASVIVVQPPAGMLAGVPFGLTVDEFNAQGQIDTSYNGRVTVSFANNPGDSTLGGVLTVQAVNGVATFSGLTISNPGLAYRLQVSAAGAVPITTSSVDVAGYRLIANGPTENLVWFGTTGSDQVQFAQTDADTVQITVTAVSGIATGFTATVAGVTGDVVANEYDISGDTDVIGGGGLTTISSVITVGDGDDTIIGGGGANTIVAGNGDNSIYGNGIGNSPNASGVQDPSNTITVGDGNNTIFGNYSWSGYQGGNNTITAGNGNNTIYGNYGFGGYQIDGAEGGDNTITVGNGANTIYGNFGNADGGEGGNNTIIAGDGDDIIFGNGGGDNPNRAGGNNFIQVGNGNDTIYGNFGGDGGEGGNNTILTGSGTDTIYGNFGGDGGIGGNNLIVAGGGNDTIYAHCGVAASGTTFGTTAQGQDLIIGGSGTDTVFGWPEGYTLGANTGDLFIAGTTNLGLSSLDAVLAEWDSSDSYATRVADLSGLNGTMGANGGTFLISGTTAIGSTAVDEIFGTVDSDDGWYLVTSNDVLNNVDSDEVTWIDPMT